MSSLLPFSRNEFFVGRNDQLRSLEELIRQTSHRRITIFGLGGCGKSALALECAYRAIAIDARCLVFWVPGISRETFELAYRNIGVLLGLSGITDNNADVKQLVKKALDSGSLGDWLMIVDNVDDASILLGGSDSDSRLNRLYDYLPRSERGKIIFTTRSRKAAEDLTPSNIIKLNDMDRTEARQLVEQRLSEKALLQEEAAIDELLQLLAHLPLAIVQATAFINRNGTSIAEYISLFRQPSQEIQLFSEHFEDPSRYREMESTIAKTWHISFDQILKQDRFAADYLSFMSCIGRVNIPQSLLPPGNSLDQAKAIGTLKGYEFITESQKTPHRQLGEKLFNIHRLVHMASTWWLKEHDEWTAWTRKAAARLEVLIPYGGHDGKKLWMAYLPHAIHVVALGDTLDDKIKASILDRVGGCEYSLGQYSAAAITYGRVLKIREKILGKEHTKTLTATNNLPVALGGHGQYEEAESMQTQLIEKVPEKLHADMLKAMNNLAVALGSQGKYKEAVLIHRQTLAMREKVLGKNHPKTLTTMSNLAEVLGKQGQHEEAESMYRLTLAMREKVIGKGHPDTLTTRNNLAEVLDGQGKHKEAELMHRHTLATSEKVLGKEYPGTLTIKHNLAGVLDGQGKHEEAESMFRQVLATREKVLGKEHPETLTSINNLALVLGNQGKYEEEEKMHRQTLATREKVLGNEHPETLTTMINLACVLDSQSKYEEAESMYRQTLATTETVLGKEHPTALTIINNLARVLGHQGKYDETESMYRQALAAREKVLGKKHPDTLGSVYCLAHFLANQHCYDKSAPLYERAYAGYVTVLGNDHPTTHACYQHYSEMLMSREQDPHTLLVRP